MIKRVISVLLIVCMMVPMLLFARRPARAAENPQSGVEPKLESITLDFDSLKMASDGHGSAMQLTASFSPEGCLYDNVTWTSSNPDVVAVTSSGILSAVSAGEAIVTVRDESGVSASCIVTVADKLRTLSIPASAKLIDREAFVGVDAELAVLPDGLTSIRSGAFKDCTDLRYIVIPSSVVGIGEDAFSGCDNLCILCEDGSAAALFADSAHISHFDLESSVKIPVKSVSLNASSLSITAGNSAHLTASVRPANATCPDVRWISSNKAVATVADGKVTAIAAGTAVITANASDGSGASASCTVIVSAPVSEPEETNSISFADYIATPSETDAYVQVNAVAASSGSFTKSGLRIWDSSGALVASKDEDSVYTRSSLKIWYNITEETGAVLKPASAYTWQIYTVFDGVTYWSKIQTFTTVALAEIEFTDYASTPASTDAYVYAKAVADSSGSFTKSGLRVWNSSGALVVSKDETSSYTRDNLQIWYNITEETGVVLTPGTTYTWQIYTIFNGTTYWSDKSIFTTLPAVSAVTFTDMQVKNTSTNAYLYVKANTSLSGNYTNAGMRVWNAAGTLVASKDEGASSSGTMKVWYDVVNETGKSLSPGTKYTAQMYVTFEGETYWTSSISFTTSSAASYSSSLSNAQMVSNINNCTDSGVIPAAKKTAMVTMAEELLAGGYSPSFVAGVLANIYHEGTFGKFESSNYSSNEPAYLVYMDNNYAYRTKYSGKLIYNGISLSEVKAMLDELAAAGYPGKFGLGSVQWTGGRTRTLVGLYISEAGSSDTITIDQVIRAEVAMIKNELGGSYSSICTKWKSNYTDSERFTDDAAFNAGYNVCIKYEVPSDYQKKALTRGQTAVNVFNVMMGK